MKISSRLLLLSGSTILAMAITIILSWYTAEKVDFSLNKMTKQYVPAVFNLQQISFDFSAIRLTLDKVVIADEVSDAQNYGKQYEEQVRKTDEDLQKMADNVAPEARERSSAMRKAIAEWAEQGRRVVKLASDGQFSDARVLRLTMYEAGSTVDNVIQKSLDINKTQFNAARDASATNLDINSWATYIPLGIAIVISLVLSWLTFKSVVGSVDGLKNGLTALAADMDFTRRFKADGKDEISDASRSLNAVMGVLQDSFRNMHRIVETVKSASASVLTASNQMATASQHTSEAASSMSATVEEMTVSVNHVADRATETDEVTKRAGTDARTGGEVINTTISGFRETTATVQQAAGQIQELKEKTAAIGTVVDIIKGIADQTNLLALNAAIEAARAGEHGRGFAVVADEVRHLAERTATSTTEITDTVQAMQTGTETAVNSMEQVVSLLERGMQRSEGATSAMSRIITGADSAASSVEEISTAMREQALAASSIAQQVEAIAQMTEEGHAGAQSNTKAAQDLNHAADELQGLINRIKV